MGEVWGYCKELVTGCMTYMHALMILLVMFVT
jgi:hypothetical protein